MTKTQLAEKHLQEWFKTNKTVSSLEFKLYLRIQEPGEDWTQSWVSTFLDIQLSNYDVVVNMYGESYRVYIDSIPTANLLTLSDLQDYVTAMGSNITITKSSMKTYFRQLGYSLDNFKELFNQLNLQHNGKYTSDNHKIWTVVPAGKHLSKTKGELVDIKDMPKPYLRNAIIKSWGNTDIKDVLDTPQSELYKELQAFFTYDIRQKLNQI